jgi:hypothetical protein
MSIFSTIAGYFRGNQTTKPQAAPEQESFNPNQERAREEQNILLSRQESWRAFVQSLPPERQKRANELAFHVSPQEEEEFKALLDEYYEFTGKKPEVLTREQMMARVEAQREREQKELAMRQAMEETVLRTEEQTPEIRTQTLEEVALDELNKKLGKAKFPDELKEQGPPAEADIKFKSKLF